MSRRKSEVAGCTNEWVSSNLTGMTLVEAYARCSQLAEKHYENFPVGLLVPKEKRRHIHAVYAFARYADDLADEGYDPAEPNFKLQTPEQRLKALDTYADQLRLAFEGKDEKLAPATAWIFLPVADTSRRLKVPQQLFHDLLSAFKQDVVKRRYETFEEVLDYCRRSANPVGRLVLHLHDLQEERLMLLSDSICTALQLANFWQDVSVDIKKDRIYIPLEDQRSFGFDETALTDKEARFEVRKCLEFQVDRTWKLFEKGKKLPAALPWPLSWEIRFTWLGGTTILKKIESQKYDTLARRPKLRKLDMILLFLRSII